MCADEKKTLIFSLSYFNISELLIELFSCMQNVSPSGFDNDDNPFVNTKKNDFFLHFKEYLCFVFEVLYKLHTLNTLFQNVSTPTKS